MEQFASCYRWRCHVVGEPSPGNIKDLTSLKATGFYVIFLVLDCASMLSVQYNEDRSFPLIVMRVFFFFSFQGNAVVLFVIIKNKRMRNITNFFLANLAASDFCVGVFCVIPNLMSFFTSYWYAGKVRQALVNVL